MKPMTLSIVNFCFSFVEIVLRILLDRDSLGKTGGNLRRAVGTRDISSFAFSFHSLSISFYFLVWWRLGTYDLIYFSVFILTPFSTEHWLSMFLSPHPPFAQISWISNRYSPDSKAVESCSGFIYILRYFSSLTSYILSVSKFW